MNSDALGKALGSSGGPMTPIAMATAIDMPKNLRFTSSVDKQLDTWFLY
jgi:hypothetical protein